MNLLNRLRITINKHDLLSPGDTVIVGVSGGSDSVCLLNLLKLLDDLKLKLIIAHVNHCLRGAESDIDAKFVKQAAINLGLEFELLVIDAADFGLKTGRSLEESGRIIRYRFFDELVKKHNADKIATAHTSDDQIETVLMRFIRGSGIKGLSGIPYYRKPNIIRPLLDVSKEEIRKYLNENNIDWIEDSSNLGEDFYRNRIRHKVLPVLQEINPTLGKTILRTSEILAENESYISKVTDKTFRNIFNKSLSGMHIGNLRKFKNLHWYIKSSVIREAISRINENLLNIDFNHVNAVIEMLTSKKVSGEINLPGDIVVAKSYENFIVTHKSKINPKYSYRVGSFGEYEFEHICFEIKKAAKTKLDLSNNIALIEPKKFKFPIEIRNFRPGDKFVPLGMKGEKKLKDFFIDEKIPRYMRKLFPIFVINSEIAWVGGLRVSENFKVRGKENVKIEISEMSWLGLN